MSKVNKLNQNWTYRDYRGWSDDERWELINGHAYNMTPAPTIEHQNLVGNIYRMLYQRLSDTGCHVLISPVDVLLPAKELQENESGTVMQPDILVVCDKSKLKSKYVVGAPDLIVEVLSPSTAKKDEGLKRDVYEAAGVQEYWLVHPMDHTINRYALIDGCFQTPDVFGLEDSIVSTRFIDFVMQLSDVFELEPEKMRQPESNE